VTELQTEFDFALPRGYLDSSGELHREGRMRLATAGDEILPLKDRINSASAMPLKVTCPYCEQRFEVEPSPAGESSATPSISSTGR
jgi:hypothetical protein